MMNLTSTPESLLNISSLGLSIPGHLPCLVVSLPIILLTKATCELLYRLLLTNVLPGIFRSFLLDLVSGGEAGVVSWELITVYHEYGLGVWTVCTYLSMVGKVYLYRPDCVSCPYSHIMSCITGLISVRDVLIRVAAQIMGASVFFRLQCLVWDLGLTDIHVARSYFMSYGVCTAWLSVPTWLGFIIECTGAWLSCVFASLLFDFQLLPSVSLHKRIFLNSGITISYVLIAFYHTGGFLHPLLAFIRTFGCQGVIQPVSVVDHLTVYWVGPTIGAVISIFTAQAVKQGWNRWGNKKKKESQAIVVNIGDKHQHCM